MTTDNVQLPPHDLEAEEATLGSLLIDPGAIAHVNSWLKPSMFYREKNNWTYRACIDLYERNTPIDQVTVIHELSKQNKLEASGGADYIAHLIGVIPTSVFIEHYARIIEDCYHRRQLISVGSQISALGYQAEKDFGELLGKSQELLNGIKNGHNIPAPFSYRVNYV